MAWPGKLLLRELAHTRDAWKRTLKTRSADAF
jgi:hypothetical protein